MKIYNNYNRTIFKIIDRSSQSESNFFITLENIIHI